MATLVERALGAARLDAAVYEEIEHDPAALGQAMTVVAVAAVCAGIGAAQGGVGAIIAGVITSLIGWMIWATLTWIVGTKMLPEPTTKATLGELLRVLGFSAAPGVLSVFGFIPVVGAIVALLALGWQLAAMVVAVRAALDYTANGRAIAVCLIGFVVYLLVVIVVTGTIGALIGVTAGVATTT
jgi:hypothetical protein